MAIDWNLVTSDHIKEACRRLDAGEVTCRNPARNTFIRFRERNYPAKFIRGVAYEIATGKRLNPNTDFSGGRETVNFFTKIGFQVQYGPSKTGPIIPSPRSPPPPQSGQLIDETTISDVTKLGVIQQKEALHRILQAQFGEVRFNHPFEWLVVPEILAETDLISGVHKRLSPHRNFEKFSKPGQVLRCDFYIPKENLIIEYDERQHFTEPRALSLEAYPPTLSLGFELEKWLAACRTVSARDNDPPYRDEQRAFYDSIRDILSYANGTLLVRVKHADWNWNSPESAQYLTEMLSRFGGRNMVSLHYKERNWRIETRYDRQPRPARLLIAGPWEGNAKVARDLLLQICAQWPANIRPACLVTPGAFLRFEWPPNMSQKNYFLSPPGTIQALIGKAEQVIRNLLDNELVGRLRTVTRYLTVGVASPLQNKITTTNNRITPPHVELVCIVDVEARPFRLHWTGKSYPTTGQADRLVRVTDLESHFLTLDGLGKVMVLGCHDLTMFSPRARANAQGWRRDMWKSFEAIAQKEQPTAVLHHPHTTVKTRTWSQAWNGLGRSLSSVNMWIGAGRYQEDDREQSDYDPVYSILAGTKRSATLDFIAYPA
jgi:hypothetical protein